MGDIDDGMTINCPDQLLAKSNCIAASAQLGVVLQALRQRATTTAYSGCMPEAFTQHLTGLCHIAYTPAADIELPIYYRSHSSGTAFDDSQHHHVLSRTRLRY